MCKVLSKISIWKEFIDSELSKNNANNVCLLNISPETIEKNLKKVGNQFWLEFVLPITGKTDHLEITPITAECGKKEPINEQITKASHLTEE